MFKKIPCLRGGNVSSANMLATQVWGPQFDPPEPMEKQSTLTHVCGPSTREAEPGKSLDLASQPSLISSPSENSISQNKMDIS